MATAKRSPRSPRYSIRVIWGLAKSPELSLSEEDLYAIIERETNKDSIRQLTQGEIDRVCRVLSNMKDDLAREAANTSPRAKRTDEGGNARTERQRKKIYMLTGELGWNDDNRRINGFVKRMFGVERLDWLKPSQCNQLIEALKKMVARQEEKS